MDQSAIQRGQQLQLTRQDHLVLAGLQILGLHCLVPCNYFNSRQNYLAA